MKKTKIYRLDRSPINVLTGKYHWVGDTKLIWAIDTNESSVTEEMHNNYNRKKKADTVRRRERNDKNVKVRDDGFLSLKQQERWNSFCPRLLPRSAI